MSQLQNRESAEHRRARGYSSCNACGEPWPCSSSGENDGCRGYVVLEGGTVLGCTLDAYHQGKAHHAVVRSAAGSVLHLDWTLPPRSARNEEP